MMGLTYSLGHNNCNGVWEKLNWACCLLASALAVPGPEKAMLFPSGFAVYFNQGTYSSWSIASICSRSRKLRTINY
jgi:hypothetical protein